MSEEDGDGGNRTILLILAAVVVGLPVLLIIGAIVLLVLSAVIGSFVLGVGGGEQVATPQATFDLDYDDDAGTVTITHAGGDSIQADAVNVRVGGENLGTWALVGNTDRIVAGDQLTLDDVSSGDRVRLVWHNPDGDERATIASFRVP